MTRQLTITAAEWASVQPDGTLWLVREAGWPKACPLPDPTDCNGEHCDCPLGPPVEFVQACAPCWMCGSRHEFPAIVGMRGPMPCPDCRIELVGPCRNPQCCNAARSLPLDCGWCRSTMHANGTVTLGHAYAIGQPLLLTAENIGHHYFRLAHYGPPETLVDRWAIQLRVVG